MRTMLRKHRLPIGLIIALAIVVVGALIGYSYLRESSWYKDEFTVGKQVGPCRNDSSCKTALTESLPSFQAIADRIVKVKEPDSPWTKSNVELDDATKQAMEDLAAKGWDKSLAGGHDTLYSGAKYESVRNIVAISWDFKIVEHESKEKSAFTAECFKDYHLSVTYFVKGQPDDRYSPTHRLGDSNWYYGIGDVSANCIN